MKFIVDLRLDGYQTEAEQRMACVAFLNEQLEFSASSITVDVFETVHQAAPDLLAALEGIIGWAQREPNTDREWIQFNIDWSNAIIAIRKAKGE